MIGNLINNNSIIANGNPLQALIQNTIHNQNQNSGPVGNTLGNMGFLPNMPKSLLLKIEKTKL